MSFHYTIRMGDKRMAMLFPMGSEVTAVFILAHQIHLVIIAERTPFGSVLESAAPVTIPSEHQCLDSTFVLLNKSMPQCKHLRWRPQVLGK